MGDPILCMSAGLVFTTSFHTRFPEYVRARFRIAGTPQLRFIQTVPQCGERDDGFETRSLMDELRGRGFRHLCMWSRGVRHIPAESARRPALSASHLPVCGTLGRREECQAFLALNLPGSKVVVGDGPARLNLQKTFPEAHFLGAEIHDELAAIYSSADAFVFPSMSDTFGMVLIEALACGLPVAGFPVQAPTDVLAGSGAGCLDWDLGKACLAALDIPRSVATDHARRFSWDISAQQFIHNVANAHSSASKLLDPQPYQARDVVNDH